MINAYVDKLVVVLHVIQSYVTSVPWVSRRTEGRYVVPELLYDRPLHRRQYQLMYVIHPLYVKPIWKEHLIVAALIFGNLCDIGFETIVFGY